MNEIKSKVDKENEKKRIEEKKGEEKESEPIITNDQIIDQGKKVKFKVPINFLDHTEYLEYETTEAGLRHFKYLLDPNKDEREYNQAVEIENLTFLDGVLLTWEIFDKILDNRLRDDTGNPEGIIYKDRKYDYLGIINDDVTDLLLNQVLEHGYFKTRGNQLINQFGINID